MLALSQAVAAATTTWDASHKNANVSVSGGNLTATNPSGNWCAVRSTTSNSAGKWYWEISLSGSVTNFWMAGFCSSAMPFTDGTYPGSDTNGCGVYCFAGADYYNSAPRTNSMSSITQATPPVRLGIAVDFSNLLMWATKDGSNWNAGGGASPGGSGGLSIRSAGPYFIATALYSSLTTTLATTAAGFTFSVPTGFLAWG